MNVRTKAISICFWLLLPFLLVGQKTITLNGKITDGTTGEGLPFATVKVVGNESTGTTTDIDGFFELSTSIKSGSLIAEYLGYTSMTKVFDNSASKNAINFPLASAEIVLKNVEIIGEKVKYDKKNPAVELIKEVVKNRDKNRPGEKEYLQFNQYTSKSLALNDVTKESIENGIFKKLDFIKNYIDTTSEEKSILSIYLKEKVMNYVYKNGKETRAKVLNEQKTEMDLRFFDDNIEQILDYLIQEVDVYDNNLFLLSKNFQNPISTGGLNVYRYYIIDTVAINQDSAIHLWATTANKKDIGFTGDIYINKDDRAIVKVDYTLDERANLNFARDLRIKQEFELKNGQWVNKHSTFKALFDFYGFGNGIIGKSRVVNSDYHFEKPKYNNGEIEYLSPSLGNDYQTDPEFWIKYRKDSGGNEEAVGEMIDSLNANKKFRFFKKLTAAALTGHIDCGKFEIGSLYSTYVFNPVEGSRVRLGLKTTNDFSRKLHFRGYGAYGFRDKRVKFRFRSLYTFNEDWDSNPVHYLDFIVGRDMYALGQDLRATLRSNPLTSFTRGKNTLFIESEYYQLNYDNEISNDFRMRYSLTHRKQTGKGDLSFAYTTDNDVFLEDQTLNISSIGTKLRWAPNQNFIELNEKRLPIHSRHPILELEVEKAFSEFGGNVNYLKAEFLLFKRMYLSKFGFSDFLIQGGQFWGDEVPYHLLFIPQGNQTFFYKHRMFNMMNFFEFVSDKYVSVNYRHFFNGYIMNRLPLIRNMGLRTMLTFKAVWGDLSDVNNPLLNKGSFQFPESIGNNNFTLGTDPYIEGSVGIANIFQILRIDLLKRFTYLDSDAVPELFGKKGLAIRIKFEATF